MTTQTKQLNVLVKCFTPEFYEPANAAVIEVTEDLILTIAQRMAVARRISHLPHFLGLRFFDYSLEFLSVAEPETIGLEMDEQEFDALLDSNEGIILPDSFDIEKYETARMSPCVLHINVQRQEDRETGEPRFFCGFYWDAQDKYVGSDGNVETYELTLDHLYDFARKLGFSFCEKCGKKLETGFKVCPTPDCDKEL